MTMEFAVTFVTIMAVAFIIQDTIVDTTAQVCKKKLV